MAMSVLGVANGVASGVVSAAHFTVTSVPAIVTGTAAVAGAAGNAAVGAASGIASSTVGKYAASAAMGVAGTAGAAAAGSACLWAGTAATVKAMGFTAIGPAANSFAAAWMSSSAIANGGGVAAGSLYSVVQSAAMGGCALGAPVVLAAGAVAGAVAWTLYK